MSLKYHEPKPEQVTIAAAKSPDATLGILGGGQLGRMLAMAAARLGYKTIILDPDQTAPAAQVANRHIVAGFDDLPAMAELARSCSHITFEFENVPVACVEWLETRLPVYPSSRSLAYTQDRLTEKRFINSAGIATAPFFEISDFGSLEAAIAMVNGEGILKTRRMGYDGKGQTFVAAPTQAATAFADLGGRDLILEGLVDFTCEISVVAARSAGGDFAAYDPSSNVHQSGILRSSTVPVPLDGSLLAQAIVATRRIADALEHVGVLAVEFFVIADTHLLVNEIAPRVHNSGHWTEAVCPVSQFEQHVRAVCGLPLGSTARTANCTMENLVGNDIHRVPALLGEDNLMLHLYGKSEVRPGRKMGHFTRIIPVA